MRECHTPNIPSFSALRKKQEMLARDIGIKSEHHTSSLGNHFYMNHPAKLLALICSLRDAFPWLNIICLQDWANPLVQSFIHVYPEVAGPVSEFWQAGKWVSEIDLDDLSPMWADWENKRNSHRHFYIKELAQLSDGTYVVPLRWVTIDNVVHVDVQDVDCRDTPQIKFTEYSPQYSMPHPLREKAQGCPIFRLRIMPWSDDVSGNVSKQYNAHTNMYVTNFNLPHQKLQQEYFIRFASTSPNASSSEQFVALSEDCVPGVWHDAYDCELEQGILFEIIPHVLPADNPQQSETSSHIGMAGSLGCRRDLTGGAKVHCETNEGYHSLYQPGIPREPETTIQIIRWQFWMACLGNKSDVDEAYTLTGAAHQEHLSNRDTRDPQLNNSSCKGPERVALKTQIKHRIQQDLWDWVVQQPNEFIPLPENDPLKLGLDLKPGVHYNVLLDTQGVDPHRDTPGETLHTYLLGNDKYVWNDTTKGWDNKKADLFASRLQSSSIDSLSIPPPCSRYVVQYKNSLVGKHFKMLQQLGIFHLHGLCTPLVFDLWKATGVLGAHLWFPEIKDMDSYLADLEVLIGNLLDIWGLIDPNRLLVKEKLHVMTHLVDDVRRFGPTILYATEIFECWNAIFRLCSILSNPLSPSHNIAVTLADMERFKHMVSGGWWKIADRRYIRAGSSVRSFLTSSPELQRRLGWAEKSSISSAIKRQPATWSSTLPEPQPIGSIWVHCKYVVAQSGDFCKPGFWVFIRQGASEPFAGRIAKILAKDGSTMTQHNTVVIVELFIVLDIKDTRLNMPILVPCTTGATSLAVKPKEIMLSFNVQHDRVSCKCRTETVPVRQERVVTNRTELQTAHSPEQRFILNMHALHNAHFLREVLPRVLTAPISYLQDRVASHHRFAAQLRETGPAKRAETQAKTKATRAKNKKGKDVLASAQAERQKAEQDDTVQDVNSDMEVDED
ncbi:hypothetical protein B0H17DRAFT_1163196 [Mycena rosella]|uniref:Uncharacterized protein n=1 Tax=Mycena rosella TaxID=1033263 RepID=A0AAD7G1U2_MYCRO|nr:hypothetical protein B0H17DRAFT_1163196 [Mycena rosella]